MTEEATKIHIPRVDLRTLLVIIEGTTPLITNRFGDYERRRIEDKQQKKATTGREARNPEAECKDKLYVIEHPAEGKAGRYGFPASGLKKAMVNAGYRFTDEASTTKLKGLISIYSDLLEINGVGPEMRSDPVKLQGRGRPASIAYRPQFYPWSITVPITYNATHITREQVLNLLQLAGFGVGIGDWRPEKSGTAGQFKIKEVLQESAATS